MNSRRTPDDFVPLERVKDAAMYARWSTERMTRFHAWSDGLLRLHPAAIRPCRGCNKIPLVNQVTLCGERP